MACVCVGGGSSKRKLYKIDVLNPNKLIILWTLIFEWFMVRCGPKNGHDKDICIKEIGLRA